MAFHYLWFICISTLVVFVSSITINPDVQGCSLVGLDLQRCFVPNPKTPFSIDSCCKILNQAIQAGYYCLCSLLSTSSYPVITKELALYFSNCYISVPSLTHCHGKLQKKAFLLNSLSSVLFFSFLGFNFWWLKFQGHTLFSMHHPTCHDYRC